MAESRTTSRQKSSRRSTKNGLSATDAIRRVREDLPGLLGRPVETVLGVQRNDDDQWEITVQVVELARIPNSTDVLGAYHVTLDKDGDLAWYQRHRRYTRGQAAED